MPATIRIYHRPHHVAIELYHRIGGFEQAAGEVVLCQGAAPLFVAYNLQAGDEPGVLAIGEAYQWLAMLYRAVVAWHRLPDGRANLIAFLDAQDAQGLTTTPERVRDMAKVGQQVMGVQMTLRSQRY